MCQRAERETVNDGRRTPLLLEGADSCATRRAPEARHEEGMMRGRLVVVRAGAAPWDAEEPTDDVVVALDDNNDDNNDDDKMTTTRLY